MLSRGPPPPLDIVDSRRLLQLREVELIEGAAEDIKHYKECFISAASVSAAAAAASTAAQ